MITISEIIGLGIILLTVGMMITFQIMIKKNGEARLRNLPGIDRLKKAIGLAVENGSRIHVSLGKSSLTDPTSPSALAGLATLERIGQSSSISDRPPIATSGDPGIALLSQDTLRAVYRSVNAPEIYHPSRGQLTGTTPMAYIAGAIPVVADEDVSANIMIGNFGPEIGLLTEAALSEGAFTLASSDSLPGQAVLYASAEDSLIGEELFAVHAYLDPNPKTSASLKVQDILRWVVIIALLAGAVLKLIGII